MTKEELKKLEQHLKCPSGEKGIAVGNTMFNSNNKMISESFHYLDLKPKQTILEIGHGNGAHLNAILKKFSNIEYYGLETSDTMRKEAIKHSKSFKTDFRVYNGINIPFDDNYFERIISINTLYFWSDPVKLLKEIEQTLKPKGLCVLTFIDKDFMKDLSFVGDEFTLYNKEDAIQLIKSSKLELIDMVEKIEKSKSKTGEEVDRKYIMVKIKKA